jgi:hypothetical protein
MPTKRDVVRNAPTLLHAVALVDLTKRGTIENIRRMDVAAPPSLYGPTRQLVKAVLNGQTFKWAYAQALALQDLGERKSAIEVLDTLKGYLLRTKPEWIRPLDIEHYQLSADLRISVRVDGLVKVGSELRILCLQPWRKRLEIEQLRAAITVLGDRLAMRPELVNTKLELLDTSQPSGSKVREFRRAGWDTFSAMSEYELESFMMRLLTAWEEYQRSPAEKPARKPREPVEAELFPEPAE